MWKEFCIFCDKVLHILKKSCTFAANFGKTGKIDKIHIGKTDKERVVICLIDTLIVFWNSQCAGITPAHIRVCEQGFVLGNCA